MLLNLGPYLGILVTFLLLSAFPNHSQSPSKPAIPIALNSTTLLLLSYVFFIQFVYGQIPRGTPLHLIPIVIGFALAIPWAFSWVQHFDRFLLRLKKRLLPMVVDGSKLADAANVQHVGVDEKAVNQLMVLLRWTSLASNIGIALLRLRFPFITDFSLADTSDMILTFISVCLNIGIPYFLTSSLLSSQPSPSSSPLKSQSQPAIILSAISQILIGIVPSTLVLLSDQFEPVAEILMMIPEFAWVCLITITCGVTCAFLGHSTTRILFPL